MPYYKKLIVSRKRYKKRYMNRYRRRKRRYYRRRRRRGINVMRVRGLTGFPDQLVVKLKYTDQINLTNIVGYGSYVYRMNSLFDPDLTGSGHQPLGFDQYAQLYRSFLCSPCGKDSTFSSSFIN